MICAEKTEGILNATRYMMNKDKALEVAL